MNIDINIQEEIGLKVEGILGKGAFATVYYCTHQSEPYSYAVKVFHKLDFTKHRLQSFRNQAQILSSIEHKNIVKFCSFKETDTYLYLVMEYIAGGTLQQLISSRANNHIPFTDADISLIIKSILQGIQYLHKFNIIHRDLKPENILMADPGDLSSIKIVDFGLSAQMDTGSPKNVKSQCGTLLFMAPEIIYQPSYSKAVDIWSCAVIMHILYTGKHPILSQGMSTESFKEKLKSCNFPKLTDPLADNMIKNLSKIDYTQRYSANQALRHPWITRNQDDQIPLSATQLMHSFDITHHIADMMKFVIITARIFGNCGGALRDQYLHKVRRNNFLNDQFRARSPSYNKGLRRKNIEVILRPQQEVALRKDSETIQQKKDEYPSLDSPLLAKHQKLFLKLFEKQKVALNSSPTKVNNEIAHDGLKMHRVEEILERELIKNIELNGEMSLMPPRKDAIKYEFGLPTRKIDDKKDKSVRKLNTLREVREGVPKHATNERDKNNSRGEDKRKERETLGTSKSKRAAYKIEGLNLQYPGSRLHLGKPQTAQQNKGTSRNKQHPRHPRQTIIFGARGSQS